MRLYISSFTIILLAAGSGLAYAEDSSHNKALSNFKTTLDSKAFTSAKVLPEGRPVLETTTSYFLNSQDKKRVIVREAGANWMKSIKDAGIRTKSALLAIVSANGGELWTIQESSASILDQWSDNRLFFDPVTTRSGRLFTFFGGQLTTGGDANSKGFNARLGSTLFKNRFDFSVFFGYNSIDSSPDVTLKSYGVTGRVLFPLTAKYGGNAGLQLSKVTPDEGDSTNITSVLGGINFYLPGGTFDVTLSIGNNSTYSLLMGYTLYLTKK